VKRDFDCLAFFFSMIIVQTEAGLLCLKDVLRCGSYVVTPKITPTHAFLSRIYSQTRRGWGSVSKRYIYCAMAELEEDDHADSMREVSHMNCTMRRDL
jgi:hypothetical protein